MSRDDVEQELNQADLDPRVGRELKEVIKEIDSHVPGIQTKAMMYDLIHVLLEMDERIRQMEYQVPAGNANDEIRRKRMIFQRRARYFQPSEED